MTATAASNQISSIQGGHRSNPVAPGVRCKANRHTDLDGHVFVEVHDHVKYWVARLECKCGVKRVTRYVPHTWELVDQHRYTWPKDYPEEPREDCRVMWLSSLLAPE